MSPVKKLVFVHGRSQQGKEPDQLKAAWLETLAEGLAKSNLTLPINQDRVHFPFYGDLLDGFVSGVSAIRQGADDEDELMFKLQMAEELRESAQISRQTVRVASGEAQLAQGPENWGWVRAVVHAIEDKCDGISEAFINRFMQDVYLYCKDIRVRTAVNDVVGEAPTTDEEAVVVAHSLGTVVAYQILASQLPARVGLSLTVGSPLAMKLVQNQYSNGMRYPKSVSSWYNAMDPNDIVAIHALSRPISS